LANAAVDGNAKFNSNPQHNPHLLALM